jgi:hypothetical protein
MKGLSSIFPGTIRNVIVVNLQLKIHDRTSIYLAQTGFTFGAVANRKPHQSESREFTAHEYGYIALKFISVGQKTPNLLHLLSLL